MTRTLPSSLPPFDQSLLRFAVRVVPADDRPEWLRCWQAELWHRRHPRNGPAHSAADLYPGLIRDALWLRSESWRQMFSGTAVLCLATLAALTIVATLPLLALFGDLYTTAAFLLEQVPRLLIEATLTTFVGSAIAIRGLEYTSPRSPSRLLRAQVFQTVKIVLLQVLAYLVSLDLTQALYSTHHFLEVVQLQLCTLLSLFALRWSFHDQDSRCRHCLRSLAAPARVGRPSWNFLDSNSTQLACPDGHGLLSIPEIETSWRRSSEWIAE